MLNRSEASGHLTEDQIRILKTGCHELVQGMRTSYRYVPTLGTGIVFCVLFFFSFAGHTVQFIRLRRWTSLTFGIGALTELIGWAGRTWSSECPYNRDAFLMQITTLIIAPTFFTAGLYIILGGLINRLGSRSSILSPKMYAMVFLTCDIVALIVQAIGGGMASTEADKVNGDTKPGTNIMVAGIVFQMATMIVFAVLVLDFMRRVFIQKSCMGYEKTRPNGFRTLPKSYTWLLMAVSISLTMIFIRSIYRTVELAQGWDGYLITHEVFFVGLDSSIMVVAVGIFNFFDPAFLLWGVDDHVQPSTNEHGLRGMRGDEQGWQDSATPTIRD